MGTFRPERMRFKTRAMTTIIINLLPHPRSIHKILKLITYTLIFNQVGSSALHAACAADANDIVELLLAHGADPAMTDQVRISYRSSFLLTKHINKL